MVELCRWRGCINKAWMHRVREGHLRQRGGGGRGRYLDMSFQSISVAATDEGLCGAGVLSRLMKI